MIAGSQVLDFCRIILCRIRGNIIFYSCILCLCNGKTVRKMLFSLKFYGFFPCCFRQSKKSLICFGKINSFDVFLYLFLNFFFYFFNNIFYRRLRLRFWSRTAGDYKHNRQNARKCRNNFFHFFTPQKAKDF